MLEELTRDNIGSSVFKDKWEFGRLTDIFDDGTVEVDWGRINHNCILGKEIIKSDELYWYLKISQNERALRGEKV